MRRVYVSLYLCFMNISKKTVDTLKELYTISFLDSNLNECTPEEAKELLIGFSLPDMEYIGKGIKETKKETTIEYVLNKLNTDRVYQSFAGYFNDLLQSNGLKYNAYPTTYGIGVFIAMGFRQDISETKTNIETLLNSLNVRYSTEYSEAGWVFRYKISKSAENIAIIQSIIN